MRTKRILAVMLCALLLTAFIPAAPYTAYAETSDACPSSPNGQHSWESYNYATCTDGGSKYNQCKYCHEIRDEVWVPALGHNWGNWITRRAATCTENGTRYHQCTRCGKGETGTIPAKGHAWDNGKVTKAATCTAAGVRTFTCKNDSRHTRTETIAALGHNWQTTTTEPNGFTDGQITTTCTRCGQSSFETIPAVPSLFSKLRNITPSIEEMGDMVVTVQPTGGQIPAYGSHALTTAVEGGTAPYTYEWHRVMNLDIPPELLQIKVDQFVNAYNTGKNEFAGAFQEIINAHISDGTIEHKGIFSYGGSLYSPGSAMSSKELEPISLDVNDHALGESESPDYPATAPGTYYCVIRDSAGHWVSTEDVEVVFGLRIVVQPQNVNLGEPGDHTLSVVAAGGNLPAVDVGTPDYNYQWYYYVGDDGIEPVEGGTESTLPVSEDGNYHCIVTDADDTQVQSYTAIVYTADPLTATMEKPLYTVTDPSNVSETIQFTISGGVPLYSCELYRGQELIESFMLEAGEDGSVTDTRTVTETGAYFLNVTDAMENFQVATCAVDEPDKLRVSTIGTVGSFDTKNLHVHVSVLGGVAPYHYTLYRGNVIVGSVEENASAVGILVDEPGVYHYVVEDARGDTDISSPITAADGKKPIITKQPESVIFEYREDEQYKIPLVCKAVSATGDNSGLFYEWELYLINESRWVCFYYGKNSINQPINASDFQRFNSFRCKVTDKNTGEYTYTDIATAASKMILRSAFTTPSKVSNVILSNERVYTILFAGGIGPYHLKVVGTYHGTDGELFGMTAATSYLQSFNLPTSGAFYTPLPVNQTWFEKNIYGEYESHYAKIPYSFTITDGIGQTLTGDYE